MQITQMENFFAGAIATKAAELADSIYGRSADDISKGLLKWAASRALQYWASGVFEAHDAGAETLAMLSELDLPDWAHKMDAAGQLETLGAVLSREDNLE